jgi:hypothetical protein
MWSGSKVHDCIKHTLTNLQRGISVLDVDQIVGITLNQMREEFRSSRERRYLTHPKTCALFEHEYEVPISDADWKKTADNMEQCLRNFYASDTFDMLKELPQQMWYGGITIIDWKTGRTMSQDVSMQLACYAMYAMEKWGVDPGSVKLIEYNFLANQGVEFSVAAAEIENTKTYIAGSIADMQSLLDDVGENVPKEESAFLKMKDEGTRANCNFRKVCE